MQRVVLPLLLLVLPLSGCGGGESSSPLTPAVSTNTPATPLAQPALLAGKFSHVVILIQENRSFDSLFSGYPGADTVSSATVNGRTIALRQIGLEDGIDVDHTHLGFETDYDGGKDDGFANAGTTVPAAPDYAYAYVNPAETTLYRTLASRFSLADRMFQSNSGPSFTAHQYLIAGQSALSAEVPSAVPWGCDAPAGTTTTVLSAQGVEGVGPFPCLDYQTLGDLLDAKSLPWALYAPSDADLGGQLWNAYDVVKHIRYGPDWTTDIRIPETTIFSDVTNATLPAVSWVTPTISHSDHPRGLSNTGPAWVASIVDAIESSKYSSSTVIFVVWDDWGGWYDHVVPQQLDVMGLGFRVPLLVISPFAKRGYVSHVPHEFGSLLKFTEENFGLGSLGTVDVRADDLSDAFDFSQQPAPYIPLLSKAQRAEMGRPIPSWMVDY